MEGSLDQQEELGDDSNIPILLSAPHPQQASSSPSQPMLSIRVFLVVVEMENIMAKGSQLPPMDFISSRMAFDGTLHCSACFSPPSPPLSGCFT